MTQSRERIIADAINAIKIAEMERRAKAKGFASLQKWYDAGDYEEDTFDVLRSPIPGYRFERVGTSGALELVWVTVNPTGERVLLNVWNGDEGQHITDRICEGGLGFDDNTEMHDQESYYPS